MNKYFTLFAVMLFLLPTIGVVSADIKCAWEPCGTKVEQCTDGAATEDAVYALVIPGVTPGTAAMAFAFFDANGNGAFDSGECAYIDVNAGVQLPGPGANSVEPGDLRVTGSCGSSANTPVLACDIEMGTPLTYMPAQRPQNIVGFVDIDNSGYYSLIDPLYLDTDIDGFVSSDDIRLTGRTDGIMNFQPYSVVQMSDYDITSNPNVLRDLVTQTAPIITDMNDLLGFVDTSCDNTWDNREMLARGQSTGEDKLYIQQMVLAARSTFGVLDPFEDFVTIGDFRLYMPPNDDCWPDCGTKVEQCDTDATYPMLIPGVDVPLTGQLNVGMTMIWVDKGVIGRFEAGKDSVYIDTNPASGPTIAAGDVRLTPNCGCEANTVVGVCGWCDIGETFAAMPQNLVGFVDIDGNGRYDLGDPLYLDTSSINVVGVGIVSVNDLRLTGRTDSGMNYGPYTPVIQGQTDISLNPTGLQDLMFPHGGLATPINTLLGFVDSQCDGFWDTEGTDKLYLQQMVFPLVNGVAGVNQFDRFTTIGDFRLYMPTDEACWPDCGTKVEQCDVDATYGLLRPLFDVPQDGAVPGMDIRVSTEGCVYVDTNIGGPARVDVGDIRLSACCGEVPNTVVEDCDCDYDRPFAAFPGPGNQNTLLGYVDVNDNDIYDIEDALYLNLDQIGIGAIGGVSPGDLRLTGRTDAGMNYLPYTFVVLGDADETGSAVGNTLRTPKNNVFLPGNVASADPEYYFGFIDSNCDGLWDPEGYDELYLQQMVPEPFVVGIQEPQFNAFSTIGDFRLYVMPVGTGPVPCPWDISGDGNVDINDVLMMIPHWGTNWPPGDFDTSGTITINDVIVMIPHWGPCP